MRIKKTSRTLPIELAGKFCRLVIFSSLNCFTGYNPVPSFIQALNVDGCVMVSIVKHGLYVRVSQSKPVINAEHFVLFSPCAMGLLRGLINSSEEQLLSQYQLN